MTAFIPQISSRPILKTLGIHEMLKAVNYRLKEMNESLERLTYVAKLPLSYSIKSESLRYIERQCKLIEITEDLQDRLTSLRILDKEQLQHAYKRGHIQQLIQEVELLNEMHFQVKKSYFTFLTRYYKPRFQGTTLMVA